MGAETGIEIIEHAGAFVLDRKRVGMRVGQQNQTLAVAASRGQEALRARQPANAPGVLSLEGGDVQAQLGAPVLGAVPRQGPRAGRKTRLQHPAGRFLIQPPTRAPGPGYQDLPEMIIEIQVQQGAVQIEQDMIDAGTSRLDEGRGDSWARHDGVHGRAHASAHSACQKVDLYPSPPARPQGAARAGGWGCILDP